MFVSCEYYVLSGGGLHQSDHLPRGVLPCVMCSINVIAKPLRESGGGVIR